MRLGSSSVNITPEGNVSLSGFAARVQPSVGVHDDLVVRALYLEAGSERLLWLHADLIGLTEDFTAAFRRWAGRELGLEERQVFLSATHTHSGPTTVRLAGCGEYDGAYVARLRGRFQQAARAALDAPETVRAFHAEARSELNHHRTSAASFHVDPRVGVLA